MYIIKCWNLDLVSLKHEQIKMITYPFNENEIKLIIYLEEVNITNETYVNLQIASKTITDNLYMFVFGEDEPYLLNSTGINIYNIRKDDYKIILTIKNDDKIYEDIPILIKYGTESSKIKFISLFNIYEFNSDQIGVLKYKKN